MHCLSCVTPDWAQGKLHRKMHRKNTTDVLRKQRHPPLCDEVEDLGPVLTSFLLLFLSDGRDIMSSGVCNRCGKVGLAVGRAAVVPDLSLFRVLAPVLLCSLCGPGLLALPRWTTSMLTRASWTAVLGTARALFKRLPAGSQMPSMWARGSHGEPVRARFAVVKT